MSYYNCKKCDLYFIENKNKCPKCDEIMKIITLEDYVSGITEKIDKMPNESVKAEYKSSKK